MANANIVTNTNQPAFHHVGVIGLGYVGLPLAVAFAEAGLTVTGFDVSEPRLAEIRQGRSPIPDVPSERVSRIVQRGSLDVTSDESRLAAADAIVICVPTPLRPTRDPDMSMIQDAAQRVARNLRAGQLVVLESTTYPGTTEEILLAALASTGLAVGKDIFLAYSPERVDPGSTSSSGYTLRNTPKIVGGTTPACLERAVSLYRTVVDDVVPVSSPRVAELAKLYENAFRVVNVAMANEMALLCDRMGLDVWEVMEAAGTKPYGFMKFLPGPGVGGHCIPIDPFYLTWKAKEFDFNMRFIELAGEINLAMPRHVFHLVERALNARRKSVHGANIVILGVAYKRDIPDVRESPALKIIELLRDACANVSYHDPFVPELRTDHAGHDGAPLRSVRLDDATLDGADCIAIITDHSTIDIQHVLDRADLVVDSRNATQGLAPGRATVFKL